MRLNFFVSKSFFHTKFFYDQNLQKDLRVYNEEGKLGTRRYRLCPYNVHEAILRTLIRRLRAKKKLRDLDLAHVARKHIFQAGSSHISFDDVSSGCVFDDGSIALKKTQQEQLLDKAEPPLKKIHDRVRVPDDGAKVFSRKHGFIGSAVGRVSGNTIVTTFAFVVGTHEDRYILIDTPRGTANIPFGSLDALLHRVAEELVSVGMI